MAKQENSNRDKKRELAFDLYMNTDKTQKEICEIVGWTQATFCKHKESGEWEILKGASTVTAQKIINKLYFKLEELTDSENIDADSLIKVAKSIEYLSNKKVTISHHINCAKEFVTWLFGKKPDLAKEFNRFQAEFINQLVSNG